MHQLYALSLNKHERGVMINMDEQEVERLKADNERLKADNDRLQAENDTLKLKPQPQQDPAPTLDSVLASIPKPSRAI